MGRWSFEQLRGGPRRTPQEAELFKDKDADEGEYPGNDYLVREVIQNALDARAEGSEGPVRVRFALHDAVDAPDRHRLIHYFSRLRAPLEAFGVEFDDDNAPRITPRFLVCEDFGTRGLEGDEHRFGEVPSSDRSRQDFFWFWRNIGSSAKTGDDLGRWGLGKTVYRAVSRARCMFGMTIRQSDKRKLLMGQCVLQPHRHGGVEYHPEGYWCADDQSEIPQPIVDQNELQQFCEEWRFTRNGEPGLSVVSPFVPEELRADRILQAVVVNFFVRILRGELVVELSGPEFELVELDAKSIRSACTRLKWGGSKRKKLHAPPQIEFVRKCLATPPFFSTELLGTQRAPDFHEGAFSPEVLTKIQHDLSAGELVAVRVRMALPRKKASSLVGQIDVYIQRAPDGERCDSYYVREGMTITRRSSRAELHGIRSLVLVESGPMAKLLGDTEGPAHEDWDKSAERPDREWKSWKNRIEFARRVVDNLVEYLTPSQTEPDFELLADFFSIEEAEGGQRNRQQGSSENGSGAFPLVPSSAK
jgi:hypothetical protein